MMPLFIFPIPFPAFVCLCHPLKDTQHIQHGIWVRIWDVENGENLLGCSYLSTRFLFARQLNLLFTHCEIH